jgi:2-phosphosulfolactate phosphatase
VKEPEQTVNITTLIQPGENWQAKAGSAAIVIDVLRATTCIVVALSFGASAVYPVASITAARKLARNLHGNPLLAGERGGLRIPGFDLGNSPLEFQSPAIRKHPIVLCTTNGSKAIERFAGSGRPLYTAALVNLSAATEALSQFNEICIVCAGKEGRFSLEDAFCAGGVITKLNSKRKLSLDDPGLVCQELWEDYKNNPLKLLQTCNHGIYLQSLGMSADLEFCSQVDIYDRVPRWTGKALRLEEA